ncbi:MAG: hypothetical protein IKI75_06965 [Lachnospiraceae bacterium]|nr:hypothetical protein [Lachnospiraceae bacterium]
MDIVIAGYAGLSGSLKLFRENAVKAGESFPPSYVKRMERMFEEGNTAAAALRTLIPEDALSLEAGNGGVNAALWDICGKAGCGMRLRLKEIPLLQETVELCELLGRDPYTLESRGTFVIFSHGGDTLAEELKAEGHATALCGHTAADAKRLLIYDGIERFLTKPENLS